MQRDMKVDIVLRFADENDARSFVRFLEKSKSGKGTPGALVCGLASSAVKRAGAIVLLPNSLPEDLKPARVMPAE